ncbi:MULE transposase domain-containing protein [Pseudoscourfieldia marina]
MVGPYFNRTFLYIWRSSVKVRYGDTVPYWTVPYWVALLVEAQRVWPDAPTITAADWRAAQAYVKSTRDSFVSVSSARRPSAVFLLSQEGNEHLTQRVLNDPNVSAPEYLRGKPNPLFVAELQKRAEKKAQKFEEAFLSDDDKQLKSLTYDKAIKLLRTFHMLEELPEDEKICEYVQFSCTCHGKLGIKHKFGYQCTRKCKHTLAQGLRTGLYVVPCGLELGVVSKPKSAGGRAKKAGKALECESSESDDEEEDDESSEHEDGSEEDEIE